MTRSPARPWPLLLAAFVMCCARIDSSNGSLDSGAPSDTGSGTGTGSDTDEGTGTDSDADTDADTGSETGTRTEIDTGTGSDADSDSDTDSDADSDSDSDTGSASDTGALDCGTDTSACGTDPCVDGYCCDGPCDAECEACNLEGLEGLCSFVGEGDDPDNECAWATPDSCGLTGSCDGEGACVLYGTDTPCSDGNPCTTGDSCDGEGACAGGGPTACEPGAGNECCQGDCSDFGGCLTEATPCADECSSASLVTGLACVGCGGPGAIGICSLGTTHPCTNGSHTQCAQVACGGVTYYCTSFGGSWAWRASDPRCNDGDPCTRDDVCASGSCEATSYTCESDLCADRACDGEGGCDETIFDGLVCGIDDCPGDSCTLNTWHHYADADCSRECDSEGNCVPCACTPTDTICPAGGGCCNTSCSPAGCSTVAGSCGGTDTCGANTLTVASACTGCGAAGATGTCGGGGSYVCDGASHAECETRSCGLNTYYCTYLGGVWQWRTAASCDDGNLCTYGDRCAGGSCAGTQIACNSTDCMTRTCDGDSTCAETPKGGGTSCGSVACAGDYCSGGTFYDYPSSCTSTCNGSGGCTTCTCNASATPCTVGGGNQCCTATCSPLGGCSTAAGACADVCQSTTLATGRTCDGCGAYNAAGSCSAGAVAECSASSHTACAMQTCGGTAYYCTNAGGTWQWRTSAACDDGNACTAGEACSGGACTGGSSAALCPDGQCSCGETSASCPQDCGCALPADACATGSQNRRKCTGARIIGRSVAGGAGYSITDTTCSAYDDFDDSTGCWDANSDHAYRLFMLRNESVRIRIDTSWNCPSDYSYWNVTLKIFANADCSAYNCSNKVFCDYNEWDFDKTYVAPSDGWYVIVVDGSSAFDDEGDYTFKVNLTCNASGCGC